MVCALTMKVKGMTCGGCVSSVKQAIAELNGIERVDVDLKKGEAEILFDDTYVDPRRIAEAITGAGYRPQLEAA